jgi:ribosomal protein L28
VSERYLSTGAKAAKKQKVQKQIFIINLDTVALVTSANSSVLRIHVHGSAQKKITKTNNHNIHLVNVALMTYDSEQQRAPKKEKKENKP